ncbi:hypothetical protein BGZ79_010434 [Entomortierella chlamydospora]|nr:hypothetical protein BGZ79_010434 [Entomortierella chlamydospora]
MGGGWSRFKEQLLQSTSLKTPMSDTPDGAVVQSAIEQEPLQIEEETSQQQRSDLKKFEFMKMFQGSLSISSTSASAPTPAPSSTHVRDCSKSGERTSLKATVMRHLKVPPLFSNSNNTNSNGINDQTERSKHRLRQWSASLFTPSLLRSASTAA